MFNFGFNLGRPSGSTPLAQILYDMNITDVAGTDYLLNQGATGATNDAIVLNATQDGVGSILVDGTTDIDTGFKPNLDVYSIEETVTGELAVLDVNGAPTGSLTQRTDQRLLTHTSQGFIIPPTNLNLTLLPDMKVYKVGDVFATNVKAEKLFEDADADYIKYVDVTIGDDLNNGDTEDTAYKSINKALQRSGTNVTIYVKSGTYVDTDGFNYRLMSGTNVNVIGYGGQVISQQTNPAQVIWRIINDKSCYLENITFDGGKTSMIAYNGTTVKGKGCQFINAAENGFSALYAGLIIFEDCVAEDNIFDGFSYHNADAESQLAIEINCIGRNNGSTGYANNGSTIHDGGSIVRINGEYYENENRNIHDIGDCVSWNLGVTARDGQEAGEGNFVVGGDAADVSEMWLQNCISSGVNNKDTAEYVLGDSTIYTYDFDGTGGIVSDPTTSYTPTYEPITKYYINGIEQDVTPPLPDPAVTINLNDTAVIGYPDTIDRRDADFKVYTDVRTAAEILADHNTWISATYDVLTDGSGDPLTDENGVYLYA